MFSLGDNVLVKDYTIYRLEDHFGRQGKKEFWTPFNYQDKYVGKVGVIKFIYTAEQQDCFYTVEFCNGRSFMFDKDDLKATTKPVTPQKDLFHSSYEVLSETEISLAKEVLLARMHGVKETLSDSLLQEMVRDSVYTAILFNHETKLKWDRQMVLGTLKEAS